MAVSKAFLLQGLLQQNYLPTQKGSKEEMPPILGSATFTPEVAKKLAAAKPRNVPGYPGYDGVTYKLTRFNGVPRLCAIPHPAAYAHLALCIHDQWDNLDYVSQNAVSLVRPTQHADGRLMIMDYESQVQESERHLKASFGRRILVDTDIANCFPSVYSHAIPWAVVGLAAAKKAKNDASQWFNELDGRVRQLNRGETQGVAVGPATSNIILEAILARVDEALRKDFTFFRFIDDYKAYCDSTDQAQEFVNRLSQQLSRYKFMLNIGKTQFIELPQALTEDWVTTLALVLPRDGEIGPYHAVSYLNLAVRLAKEVPGGSVIKYAAKALIRQKMNFMAKSNVVRYLLTLAAHQPTLLPLLAPLFDDTLLFWFSYGNEVQQLAQDNARFGRSDGMAWCLYYLNKYGVAIGGQTAEDVVASRDCVGLLLLYHSGHPSHQADVVAFATGLDASDLYELDQYWLLLYELFREGAIENPYTGDDTFAILKDNGVRFVA